MTSKTRIAVLVAALFLGAQAGIAALNQEAAEATAEAAETTEAVETAEATEATPTEAPEATAAAEQPAVEAPAPAPTRFAPLVSDTFPRTASGSDMLPGLAAYLDQREAAIAHLVARGDAFPTPSGSPMLPALASYLDQREAQLVAQLEREMQAAGATPVALATQQPARAN